MSGERRPKGYSTSHICAYIPGESPLERHARRLQASWAGEMPVRIWCEYRNIEFAIQQRGGGHPHAPLWVFKFKRTKSAAVARWWPGQGRFESIAHLAGKRLRDGRKVDKVYDWQVLLSLLEAWFAEIPHYGA